MKHLFDRLKKSLVSKEAVKHGIDEPDAFKCCWTSRMKFHTSAQPSGS